MNSHLDYLDLDVRETDVLSLTVLLLSLLQCLKSQESSFLILEAHLFQVRENIFRAKSGWLFFFLITIFSCGCFAAFFCVGCFLFFFFLDGLGSGSWECKGMVCFPWV